MLRFCFHSDLFLWQMYLILADVTVTCAVNDVMCVTGTDRDLRASTSAFCLALSPALLAVAANHTTALQNRVPAVSRVTETRKHSDATERLLWTSCSSGGLV